MVHIEKIKQGAAEFLDAHLIPKIPGFKGVAFAAFMSLLLDRLSYAIEQYRDKPIIAMLDIIEEDMVDIDGVYSNLRKRMTAPVQLDIPMIGTITITQTDLDRLYQKIKEA